MKLELTIEEVNYILNLLAERPYRESCKLIEKIQSQGEEKE